MADIHLRTHRAGDIGYIIHRHGVLYAPYNWGPAFEAWVAQIMASFLLAYDPEKERCWIAERDGRFQGSVVLCSGGDADTAKIRVLLVEPEARGQGLGKRLAGSCVEFARQCGYKTVRLTTQSNLEAARRMYEGLGFQCVGRERARHFEAQDSEEETWELVL